MLVCDQIWNRSSPKNSLSCCSEPTLHEFILLCRTEKKIFEECCSCYNVWSKTTPDPTDVMDKKKQCHILWNHKCQLRTFISIWTLAYKDKPLYPTAQGCSNTNTNTNSVNKQHHTFIFRQRLRLMPVSLFVLTDCIFTRTAVLTRLSTV